MTNLPTAEKYSKVYCFHANSHKKAVLSQGNRAMQGIIYPTPIPPGISEYIGNFCLRRRPSTSVVKNKYMMSVAAINRRKSSVDIRCG